MKIHIIRGASGSGKSTLAHSLTPHVFEADQFFMKNGVYEFNPALIKNAHADCKVRVELAMIAGRTPLAVANTFTRHWEYQPYVDLAKRYGYEVEMHICEGRYPNVHNVPADVVQAMRDRFEY